MPNIELVPTCGPEAFAVLVDGDRVGTVAHGVWSPAEFPTARAAARALVRSII